MGTWWFFPIKFQVSYCENDVDCRRLLQLVHFGEKFDSGRCGKTCDNCSKVQSFIEKDCTLIAKQLVRKAMANFINSQTSYYLLLFLHKIYLNWNPCSSYSEFNIWDIYYIGWASQVGQTAVFSSSYLGSLQGISKPICMLNCQMRTSIIFSVYLCIIPPTSLYLCINLGKKAQAWFLELAWCWKTFS